MLRAIIAGFAFQTTPAFAEDVGVGTPLQATIGQSVRLDPTGGLTRQVAGSYRTSWRWIERPAVSVAEFEDPQLIRPALTIDVPGTYVAAFDMHDGDALVQTVLVTVSTENTPPVAQMEIAAPAELGAKLTLDGSSSYDVDGDRLTYGWSVAQAPAGGFADFADANAPLTTLTLEGEGTYTIQLDVTDAKGAAARTVLQTVTVDEAMALGRNIAPTGRFGLDQYLTDETGSLRIDTLQSTDAEADVLTSSFSVLGSTDTAVEIAPDGRTSISTNARQDSLVTATVDDGQFTSLAQTLIAGDRTVGVRPVAKVSPVSGISAGTPLTLDGTQSYDLDGPELTYSWSILHAPDGQLATIGEGPRPTFTPDGDGPYIVQLVVSDGTLRSVPKAVLIENTPQQDIIPDLTEWPVLQQLVGSDGRVVAARQTPALSPQITLTGDGERPPLLTAQTAEPVLSGTPVRLTSTAMHATGGLVNQSWSLLHKPARSLMVLPEEDLNAPLIDIIPDVPGLYLIQLIARADGLIAEPVVYAVTVMNSPPVARIAEAGPSVIGETISLDGRRSFDPDADALQYAWTLIAAPEGSSSAVTESARPVGTLTPDTKGTYRLQLSVTDGSDKATQSLDVEVVNRAPVAQLDAPHSALVGEAVMLSASATIDLDGDALDYAFQVTAPDGTVIQESGAVT